MQSHELFNLDKRWSLDMNRVSSTGMPVMEADPALLSRGPWAAAAPGRSALVAERTGEERSALFLERCEAESAIPDRHAVRVVWSYSQQVELAALRGALRQPAHVAGQPPPDVRILLALWLYACIEGVGNARAVERLTEADAYFRWLRGGVPLNHHVLSDFRWQTAVLVDRLLMRGIVSLWSEGLVSLASLDDDCVRVRAPSGAASFRRLATLDRLLAEAEERVTRLRQEIDADPVLSDRRHRLARERALRSA